MSSPAPLSAPPQQVQLAGLVSDDVLLIDGRDEGAVEGVGYHAVERFCRRVVDTLLFDLVNRLQICSRLLCSISTLSHVYLISFTATLI